MQGTTGTTSSTTGTTVAPLANTAGKAAVRVRRANTALAKQGTAALASKGSTAPGGSKGKGTTGKPAKAASYVPVPLVVNAKYVAAALAQYKSGAKPARAASVLGCTVGQYAMRCMLGGTTPLGGTVPQHWYGSGKAGAPGTPAALATYCAKGRAAGRSWGWLAAATRTTEGTVRTAYQVATGKAHSTSGVGAWQHRNG